MKDFIRIISSLLFVVLAISFGIWLDIYKWHTFEQVTHSNISFWKWQFVFNSGHK